MPADFQSLLGYTKDRPIPITGYSGNVIKISSSGAIYWNEVELTGRHGPYPILEPYLAVTAEMNPAPLTYLDFDRGAPCSVIDNVRAMMRERLACGQGGVCLQGNAKF